MSTEQRMLARDRAELDRIDADLAALIQRRGEVVRRIHDAKAASAIGPRDLAREREVLARLDDVQGAYPLECLRQVWCVLMFWAPATSDR